MSCFVPKIFLIYFTLIVWFSTWKVPSIYVHMVRYLFVCFHYRYLIFSFVRWIWQRPNHKFYRGNKYIMCKFLTNRNKFWAILQGILDVLCIQNMIQSMSFKKASLIIHLTRMKLDTLITWMIHYVFKIVLATWKQLLLFLLDIRIHMEHDKYFLCK